MNRLNYLCQRILDAIPLTPEASALMERKDTLSPQEIAEQWNNHPDDVISAAFHTSGDQRAFKIDVNEPDMGPFWAEARHMVDAAQGVGSSIRQILATPRTPDDEIKVERFKRYLDQHIFKGISGTPTPTQAVKIHTAAAQQTISMLMAIEGVKAGIAPEPVYYEATGTLTPLEGLLEEMASLAENSPVAKDIALWMLAGRLRVRVNSDPDDRINYLKNAKRDLVIAKYLGKDEIAENSDTPINQIYSSLILGSIISKDQDFKEQCRVVADGIYDQAKGSMEKIIAEMRPVMPPDKISKVLTNIVNGIYVIGIRNGARAPDLLPGIQKILSLLPKSSDAPDPSGLLNTVEFDAEKASDLLAHFSKTHPKSISLPELRSHNLSAWQADVVKKAFPGPKRIVSQDMEP